MVFDDIIDLVRKKFGLPVEFQQSSNLLLLRINGIDNVSLGKYIDDYFVGIKIESREIEGYKILTDGWVKIEKCGF